MLGLAASHERHQFLQCGQNRWKGLLESSDGLLWAQFLLYSATIFKGCPVLIELETE